ncbi:MAG: sigma 54-dependent Fis family transcriptional regulator [Myxococcota bacterium]
MPLARGQTIVVGRGATCDVRHEADGVAPRPAAFARGGDEVVVRDLGAPGGLWLRGERRGQHAFAGDGALMLGREPALLAELVGPGTIRWHGLVGADPRTLESLARLARVAGSRAPVWIAGESGTGKEGAARAIHRESARATGPYVAINCAALPEGLAESELFGSVRGAFTGALKARTGAFVQAHRGTLLLDEVGELSPAVQAKLLRAIESGEIVPVGSDRPIKVDVRIVAATWRDLQHEAELGRFRHDLLHRLWVLKVDLPPLRERARDLAPLVGHLLMEAGRPELMPSEDVLALMRQHPWPGNVRELKNGVERAVAFHDPLELVPREVRGPRLPRRSIAAPPFDGAAGLIRSALRSSGNHRGKAARALGVSRSTFYRWVREALVPSPAEPALGRLESGRAGHRRARRRGCSASDPGRVDTPIAPFMMAQASVTET